MDVSRCLAALSVNGDVQVFSPYRPESKAIIPFFLIRWCITFFYQRDGRHAEIFFYYLHRHFFGRMAAVEEISGQKLIFTF
jgi:hypothetical protein